MASQYVFDFRSGVRLESGRRIAHVGSRSSSKRRPRPSLMFAKAQPQSLGGQSLDLVIIDLTLPGLNVPELIAGLRALPNGPRIVVAFGPHVQDAALRPPRKPAATWSCLAANSMRNSTSYWDTTWRTPWNG